MKTKTYILGEGVLNWFPEERRSNRYGYVHLDEDITDHGPIPIDEMPPDGTLGTLSALIIEPRRSGHIGDFFNDVRPRFTAAGTILTLGHGRLTRRWMRHRDSAYRDVGVKSGKSTRLDIRALYDCHEHVVRLIFVTGKKENFPSNGGSSASGPQSREPLSH